MEWNSDPEIATTAERLYGDIDYLELYVGLQAEEAKPLVDGAGLCPGALFLCSRDCATQIITGYTISRAILSDAIALTRGDRFFTHDFTPFNLTAWGFNDCQRDPGAFGFGSTLGRLFLRTLPNHFTENSIYTFFPLMTPEAMNLVLTKLDLLDQYDLARPKAKSPVIAVEGYTRAQSILKDNNFARPYADRASRVIKGNGYYTLLKSRSSPQVNVPHFRFFPAESEEECKAVISVLSSPDLVVGIGEYFYENTKKLIEDHCYSFVNKDVSGVDLVRCVLRALPVTWAATELVSRIVQLQQKPHLLQAGIGLRGEGHKNGEYTASELYNALSDIYE